jgi:hypothetical protein
MVLGSNAIQGTGKQEVIEATACDDSSWMWESNCCRGDGWQIQSGIESPERQSAKDKDVSTREQLPL